jgi:hypothetical protein
MPRPRHPRVLLGDDDTIWSLPVVLSLLNGELRGLDAEQPAMVTPRGEHSVALCSVGDSLGLA